jgi:hypothetical protein
VANLTTGVVAVQATATGTVATNYLATTRTGTNQTFTSAGDVILNTTDQSVGSSVTYNTSTGVYTLTAGTTYELSFTPSWSFSGSSNDPYVQYNWVDATTNTALDSDSGSFCTAYSYQYNFTQHNFNIISKLVYTPSTNQTVKVRVTGTQSGGITTTLATGSSAYVKAMNAIFALNTLDTMSVTGNVSVGGSLSAAQFVGNYSNGTSNVNIPAVNGNVNISSGGIANVAVITSTGANIAGTLNVTGNISAGNVSATTFTGALTGLASSATVAASANAVAGANVSGQVGNALVAGTVYTNAQPNITSVGTLTSISVSGNANVGNLGTAQVLATANVTAPQLISNIAIGTAPLVVTSTTRVANLSVDYANVADFITVAAGTGNNFIVFANAATGNVSEVTSTGITANLSTNTITATTFVGALANGNSNVNIPSANGNVNISAVGNANIVVVTGTGANITGTLNVTGNITGNTNGFAIGYLNIPQVTAANATLALTDAGKHYYSTSAGNFTLTIPTNASVAFANGTAISIVVQSAGNVLVNAISGVTLYMAGNSTAANRIVSNYGMATIMKVATNTWMINGTGVA